MTSINVAIFCLHNICTNRAVLVVLVCPGVGYLEARLYVGVRDRHVVGFAIMASQPQSRGRGSALVCVCDSDEPGSHGFLSAEGCGAQASAGMLRRSTSEKTSTDAAALTANDAH